MSQAPFQKFVSKKKNSVVKEEIRQDKKKARKEKNAYFDKIKEEKYQARMAAKNKGFSKPAIPEDQQKTFKHKTTFRGIHEKGSLLR